MRRSLLKGLQSYLNKINAPGGTGNAQVILAHLGWVQDVEPVKVDRKNALKDNHRGNTCDEATTNSRVVLGKVPGHWNQRRQVVDNGLGRTWAKEQICINRNSDQS